MESQTELQLQSATPPQEQQLQVVQEQLPEAFGSDQQFALAQRQAKALSASNVIPEAYRNNIPNCLIAMEMAHRLNISPLMVMQGMYVVKGKPSWSGQFVIALINNCGRFTPLRFDMKGEGETLQCRAVAKDAKTGEELRGTLITMKMVKSEGWGSKWQSMPEQMMQYRAGAFFGRIYAPDILMGMQSVEEAEGLPETPTFRTRPSVTENKAA